MEKLSFVVPCYRSEKTIGQVVNDVRDFISNNSDKYDYEIILVNDHSPDDVWSVIKKLAAEDPKVKGIHLARNFGQHSALMAGYREVTGDIVITIDDDGQTRVDQAHKLVETLTSDDYDVVYGVYTERKDNEGRKLGTYLNNKMLENLMGKPKNIHLTSYFAARRFIIEKICEYDNAYPYIWGLILRTTRNIGNAEIEHAERAEGTSGYTLVKLISLWMNGFTAFSVKPLRLIALFGGITAALGALGIIYVIVTKILDPTIAAGYSSMMVCVLFLGGVQLISLGLIGEYIGRTYLCINNTPQYVVKERTFLDNAL